MKFLFVFFIIAVNLANIRALSIVENSENEDSFIKPSSAKYLIKYGESDFNDDNDSKNSLSASTHQNSLMAHQIDERSVRDKRFIGSVMNLPNKNYQECITPNGVKGHCKYLRHCGLAAFTNNLYKFLDHFCVIERFGIGVCCPDEDAERSSPQFADAEDVGQGPLFGDQQLRIDNPEAVIDRPEERGCGLATKQFGKIIGGRPADPGEWPWMAALLTNNPNQAYCGGLLITDRHVLTAAHCVYQLKLNQLTIRLGEYDFTRYNETRSRDFKASEFRIHADFDPITYENDVALIKLFRPSLFNSYIWPVCMPPRDETWENWSAVVTGWGTQFFGGPHSEVLMEVNIPIWSNRQCQSVFVNRVFDTSLCAGGYQGGRDSCQGDSGGPLMVQLPNKRWVVAGIVSWGIRCGEANHPGIYTRVGSFINWIIENAVF